MGAYAIGTPGINSAYDAVSQIYTEYVFQCPAALVANESALAGFPTWRYYYNASIPNINPNAEDVQEVRVAANNFSAET